MTSTDEDSEIKKTLSLGRIRTFESATSKTVYSALNLYAWNAEVSAAMMTPLHILEVVLRNALVDALVAVYGDQWPWHIGFERSLPSPANSYNPRKELTRTRAKASTTCKLIPEFNFMFWQSLLTSRFDAPLWNRHLHHVLPHLDPAKTVGQLRAFLHSELNSLRKLRNRIAHHEPIFTRDLADDFRRIQALITCRSSITCRWMTEFQRAQTLIAARPAHSASVAIPWKP